MLKAKGGRGSRKATKRPKVVVSSSSDSEVEDTGSHMDDSGLESELEDGTSGGLGLAPKSSSSEISLNHFQPEKIEGLSFDNIGGLMEHKQKLLNSSVFASPSFNKFGQNKKRQGFLFHGPPGTGKTVLAKAVCGELNKSTKACFYMRKAGDCYSKYFGESEKTIQLLFEKAILTQPSIIFFDEFDSIGGHRSNESTSRCANSVVNSLLTAMDTINNKKVIVIAATNRLEMIDPAFRRPGRFDCELLFPIPNEDARKQIIGLNVSNWDQDQRPSQELLEELAKSTKGFNGADLEALCGGVIEQCFQRTLEGKGIQDATAIYKAMNVSREDWIEVIQTTRPSASNSYNNSIFQGTCVDKNTLHLVRNITKLVSDKIATLIKKNETGRSNRSFRTLLLWKENLASTFVIDNIIVPQVLSKLDANKVVSYGSFAAYKDIDFPTPLELLLKAFSHNTNTTIVFLSKIDTFEDDELRAVANYLDHRRVEPRPEIVLIVASSSSPRSNLNDKLKQLFRKNVIPVPSPSEAECKLYFQELFGKLREKFLASKKFQRQLQEKFDNAIESCLNKDFEDITSLYDDLEDLEPTDADFLGQFTRLIED